MANTTRNGTQQRVMIRAAAIDWVQVALMVLAATSIVALIGVDLFS